MSPFGPYADKVAVVAALAIMLAWTVSQLLGVTPTESLSTAFTLCLGYLFGSRAATNGASREASAANVRLDKIGAPPATLPEAMEASPISKASTLISGGLLTIMFSIAAFLFIH